MNEHQDDAVIAEIRAVRRRISQRAGHDPAQLVAYYMEMQRRYEDRLVVAPPPELPGRREAA